MRNIPVAITKKFEFEACHRLPDYDGPCNRMHGHSYKLEVSVAGVPEPTQGMTMDFGTLKTIVNDNIISVVDHRDLNEVMPLFGMAGATTCENMLIAFWYALDHELLERGVTLKKLRLYETSDNYGTLTRDMVYGG